MFSIRSLWHPITYVFERMATHWKKKPASFRSLPPALLGRIGSCTDQPFAYLQVAKWMQKKEIISGTFQKRDQWFNSLLYKHAYDVAILRTGLLRTANVCSTITMLALYDNQKTGHIITDALIATIVDTFPCLQALHINGGKMTDQGIKPLKNLMCLKTLRIEDASSLTTKGFTSLGTLKIRSLQLRAPLDDALVEQLGHMKNIERLALYGQHTITDRAFTSIGMLRTLRTLHLDGATYSDQMMKKFWGFYKLEELKLSYRHITSNALEYLSKLQDLRRLFLEHVSIQKSSLRQLSSFPKLQRLILLEIDITDSHAKSILHIPLRVFNP